MDGPQLDVRDPRSERLGPSTSSTGNYPSDVRPEVQRSLLHLEQGAEGVITLVGKTQTPHTPDILGAEGHSLYGSRPTTERVGRPGSLRPTSSV